MYNQMTDRYIPVKTQLVKAFPGFGHTIVAVKDYSLEIFQREYHRGSVRILEAGSVNNTRREAEKMRVYNSDIIFKVCLVSQPVFISGHVKTKDKYVRIYDITFDVVVSDPVLFVQGYRLGKDPLHVATEMFKSALQSDASRTNHDKLTAIEQCSDQWNDWLCAKTGIKILKIRNWNFRDDPKRAEMDTISQEAEKNKASMKAEAEIQKLQESLDRERQAVQRAFEREEETRDHMHELHLRLRETAAQELTDILRERIRYTFERGTPIGEVAADSMKLLTAFHESLLQGSVVDSTLLSGFSANGAPAKGDTTARDNPETDPAILHTVQSS